MKELINDIISYRLLLANQIRTLVTSALMIHINGGIGFTSELIKSISKGIVILKAIESIYLSKIDAF